MDALPILWDPINNSFSKAHVNPRCLQKRAEIEVTGTTSCRIFRILRNILYLIRSNPFLPNTHLWPFPSQMKPRYQQYRATKRLATRTMDFSRPSPNSITGLLVGRNGFNSGRTGWSASKPCRLFPFLAAYAIKTIVLPPNHSRYALLRTWPRVHALTNP
jgi:hypothetical protein